MKHLTFLSRLNGQFVLNDTLMSKKVYISLSPDAVSRG